MQNTKQELNNTAKDITNTKNILATTTDELHNTDNILRTNANNITQIDAKIGEVKVENDEIIPLQNQIDTINNTIGKNDIEGLKLRIKDLENINWGSKIIDTIKTNREKIYYIIHPLILIGKCDAKFEYGATKEAPDQNKYYYTELQCNTCTTPIENKVSTSKPSELFSTLYCDTCKHHFTAQDIEVTSYLYPQYHANPSDCMELLCSNCNYDDNSSSYNPYLYCAWATNPLTTSSFLRYNRPADFLCENCGAICIWNDNYILGELQKIATKYYKG